MATNVEIGSAHFPEQRLVIEPNVEINVSFLSKELRLCRLRNLDAT